MNNQPKNDVTFDNMPMAVSKVYEEVSAMRFQLEELINKFQPKEPPKYYTRNQLKTLLDCDLSTIHNWTKKGKIKAYGLGNRVYYLRSEIEEALVPLGKNIHQENKK